jgi:uncharacterized protein (DUF1778 family)
MLHKDEHFHLRIGSADKAMIRYAARAAGVSASRFLLEAGVRAAEETVARHNRFLVTKAQWDAFVAALDGRPASSGPAYKDADPS